MTTVLSSSPQSTEPGVTLRSDLAIALAAIPAVLILLAAGILIGLPAAGTVAAGASLTVGFGAFKRVHGSAGVAMGLAGAGMSLSALIGTLAGQSPFAIFPAVLLCGLGTGLLTAIKSDVGWVAQQCTIVLLVASAFAGSLEQALQRALLVLLGGSVQFICTGLALRLLAPAPSKAELFQSVREACAALASEIATFSPLFRRAVRLAIALLIGVEIWRELELPNGYWMAMTVLLLVRPDLRGTFLRALERILGTVAGAVVASLVIHIPAHSYWFLAAMTALFAFMTLALQQGNRFGTHSLTYPGSYAVFAASLTVYVVLLLDYGGLNDRGVAQMRVLLTACGGILALFVHIPIGGAREDKPSP